MMCVKLKYVPLIFAFLLPACVLGQQNAKTPLSGITFEVTDSLQNPLGFATVVLQHIPNGHEQPLAATTDASGRCHFTPAPGRYDATISYVGYVSKQLTVEVPAKSLIHQTVILNSGITTIHDVVITASQSAGPTSALHIGRDAMKHLQPSSFEDLLELLPGGRASDPTFSSSNHIRLREAATSNSDYATSSLGVSFMMDGVPLSNDAAMQYQSGLTGISDRVSLNAGVDMRTLPTDEIESVEIVQGISSVEYGDLTSGLIKIKRKEGGRNLEARFKADLKSQLFYLGKGFEWGDQANLLTMNTGVTYLSSRADPRNTRQNYSRMTGSWRMKKRWESNSDYRFSWGGSVDYTGSFDRVKSDANIDTDLNGNPRERYKASYSNLIAALTFTAQAKERSAFFQSLDLSASVNSEFDRIDRWRYVVLGGSYPIYTSLQEGVYDAEILPNRYEASLQVDGKPFYAYAKAMASFGANTQSTRNTFRVGAEWNMAKNYGQGLIYDVSRPISDLMTTRPRSYASIPALHRISAFVEDRTVVDAGRWRIEMMAGVRTTVTANLGSRYALQGKFHVDPRINLSAALPAFEFGGSSMRISFSGGAGWHTKTPTLDQLFPDPVYSDYTQLNYFPDDVSKRRINMVVYKYDPTNYDLRAARNFKWELHGRVSWNGYQFSATYFQEDMTSGFRTSAQVLSYSYRDYDEKSIDASALTGPPSLDELPYTDQTVLRSVARTTNGSRTQKQGIEFTLSTRRIRPLATKLIISGAYFRTRYSNSEPQYIATSIAVNDKPYPYIGLYGQEDNYLSEFCNTNFLFDTQIPRMGLIFSTSFQCQWFSGTQNQWCDPRPLSYLDTQLQERPFTDQSASDGILQHMIRTTTNTAYLYRRTPFSMYVNLKISKSLYRDRISAAIFVNRLFDYSPSYRDETGGLIRRYSSPYFGMELNFKL